MEYTALIIDDEKMARTLLLGMIERYCPEISVVELCQDLPSGVKAIHKHKPNIVFLDIEMPGHSGLELLDFLDESMINFSIIFTTAYNQYAIQAFKLSAVDYLLKPIDPTDLQQAFSTFKKQQVKRNYADLKENLSVGLQNQKLAIYNMQTIKYVDISSILFIKADGAYSDIYTTKGNFIKTSKGLKYYQDLLVSNSHFFRIHKSYLINTNHVTELQKSNGGNVVLNDMHSIPIGNEKAQEFYQKLQRFQ